ncbi:MAG: tRNA guanosine(34) transglycosylase Tgt [Parvibaculales bacterium]
MKFTIERQSGKARLGKIETAHGIIDTPAFMPVGTAGSVKGIYPEQLAEMDTSIVLGNTYHLMLRPGAEQIAELGGLHQFMNWEKSILTDSGGFQVMSLAKLRKLSEDGVCFQSHIDGTSHMLTPERSMEIQSLLGADIVMAFDECTPYPASEQQAKSSMELSMRWAERSKKAFEGYKNKNALFGIVQGGVYENLRLESIEHLSQIAFDGLAIGGLAVGEGQEKMLEVLNFTMPALPQEKPRYLMGVGTPSDLVEAVARGVDMFDCVMPTREGRHGRAYLDEGKVNIRNSAFASDKRPLAEHFDCSASNSYSRAYLHHLLKSGELLGLMLLSWHNLFYYQRLMKQIRQSIAEDKFEDFRAEFRKNAMQNSQASL